MYTQSCCPLNIYMWAKRSALLSALTREALSSRLQWTQTRNWSQCSVPWLRITCTCGCNCPQGSGTVAEEKECKGQGMEMMGNCLQDTTWPLHSNYPQLCLPALQDCANETSWHLAGSTNWTELVEGEHEGKGGRRCWGEGRRGRSRKHCIMDEMAKINKSTF